MSLLLLFQAPPSGSDVTLALTGAASTATAGSVVPSATRAISGSASTVSAGQPVALPQIPVGGSASTASAGQTVPSSTRAVSGAASTLSAGTVWDTQTEAWRANWYTPTTPGIGGSYWVRFTKLSGTVTLVGGGLWLPLSLLRTATVTNILGGSTATGVIRVQISTDALGLNVVSTADINVSLQVT